ncbi:MAG: TraV family lipoprotein [Anaerolineae bacterium]
MALLVGLAGCSGAVATSPSMHEALQMAEATGEPGHQHRAATIQTTFGYQAPYLPVVIPPDVRRVWIPTHVNEEGELVQGHWVFLRLTDWQWFTEQPHESGQLGVPVPPEATPPPWPAPARHGRRTVVPWVEETPGPPAKPPAPPEGLISEPPPGGMSSPLPAAPSAMSESP